MTLEGRSRWVGGRWFDLAVEHARHARARASWRVDGFPEGRVWAKVAVASLLSKDAPAAGSRAVWVWIYCAPQRDRTACYKVRYHRCVHIGWRYILRALRKRWQLDSSLGICGARECLGGHRGAPRPRAVIVNGAPSVTRTKPTQNPPCAKPPMSSECKFELRAAAQAASWCLTAARIVRLHVMSWHVMAHHASRMPMLQGDAIRGLLSFLSSVDSVDANTCRVMPSCGTATPLTPDSPQPRNPPSRPQPSWAQRARPGCSIGVAACMDRQWPCPCGDHISPRYSSISPIPFFFLSGSSYSMMMWMISWWSWLLHCHA